MRVKVTCPCVADTYTSACERVVEFSGSRLGGLISIREGADGSITVQVYRADRGVLVLAGGQMHPAQE